MAGARPCLVALALAAAPAAAAFEGVLDARLVHQQGGRTARGHATVWLAAAGARAEVEVGLGEAAVRRTVIAVRARPGLAWRLVGSAAVPEALSAPPVGRLRVTRLGTGAVAGFACGRVVVRGAGDLLELWIAPALAPADPAWALAAWRPGPWAAVSAALEAAGVRGWPLRWSRRGGGASLTWEVTRVAARPVEPARLALPAEAGAEPGMLTPEQRRALDEAARERAARLRNPRPDASSPDAR